VTAAIVYWNTLYMGRDMGRAVEPLRASGHPAPNNLLAHVAPLGWTHISLTGDYVARARRRRKRLPALAAERAPQLSRLIGCSWAVRLSAVRVTNIEAPSSCHVGNLSGSGPLSIAGIMLAAACPSKTEARAQSEMMNAFAPESCHWIPEVQPACLKAHLLHPWAPDHRL
jgi:hypothetical protein